MTKLLPNHIHTQIKRIRQEINQLDSLKHKKSAKHIPGISRNGKILGAALDQLNNQLKGDWNG